MQINRELDIDAIGDLKLVTKNCGSRAFGTKDWVIDAYYDRSHYMRHNALPRRIELFPALRAN